MPSPDEPEFYEQKDLLDLGHAIGVVVDVVEVPGKGLAVTPDQVGGRDHSLSVAVAIALESSRIQSLQDPG